MLSKRSLTAEQVKKVEAYTLWLYSPRCLRLESKIEYTFRTAICFNVLSEPARMLPQFSVHSFAQLKSQVKYINNFLRTKSFRKRLVVCEKRQSSFSFKFWLTYDFCFSFSLVYKKFPCSVIGSFFLPDNLRIKPFSKLLCFLRSKTPNIFK